MKTYFKHGRMIAEAQSMRDVEVLLSLSNGGGIGHAVRTHRKHKKHQFIKKCPHCGLACKGLKGLGVHMASCKAKKGLSVA